MWHKRSLGRHGLTDYADVFESRPMSSSAVRITSDEYNGSILRLPNVRKEQISTFLKSVEFLLKSCVTDSNITKEALEVAALRKTPMEAHYSFWMSFAQRWSAVGMLIPMNAPRKCSSNAYQPTFRGQKGFFEAAITMRALLNNAQYVAMSLEHTKQLQSLVAT